MLRSLKDLERCTVRATDGDIGKVMNFMLDDQHWTIRYMVAKTDGFFDERRVLISPVSLRLADWSTRCLHVALTRDKVRQSPKVDLNLPISRRQERDYYRYYGYPYYWGYTGLWGMGAYPSWLAAGSWSGAAHVEDDTDIHLRSANEVRGYHIQGSDDAIGHIDDFVLDDETWEVRYLVIDTSNWGFGSTGPTSSAGSSAPPTSSSRETRSKAAPSGTRANRQAANTKRASMATTAVWPTGMTAKGRQGFYLRDKR